MTAILVVWPLRMPAAPASQSTSSKLQLSGPAVAGLAVELGILMLLPKFMTGMALIAGLLPIMYSSGTGADVMQRIAAPMVGSGVSALLLILLGFPATFSIWRDRGY